MSEILPAPTLTVAMPVYNAGEYLRPAVMSIVKQTFKDWELLIIDDGSTDNAIDSISDLLDSRIQILRDGMNKGLAARLNESIDLARGLYFARMDQDDISYPERFAKQLDLLKCDAKLDVVAVRATRISEQGENIGHAPFALTHAEICARPWLGFYFPHPTWMGTTAWFRKNRYKIPQPYFCEDQELLLRSYRNSRFECVPEVLFEYRIREKVNHKKLFGTRLAVLKAQASQFIKTSQFHFVFLSLFAFLLRVGFDQVKRVLHFTRG